MCKNWKVKPTIQDSIYEDTTYVAYFDENGNSNINDIIKKKGNDESLDNYFSLTCVLLRKECLDRLEDDINDLKSKYWNNGIYSYVNKDGTKINKKVCFHSREIRRKTGPFSLNEINYESFIIDLTNFIVNQDFTILHCFIDKKRLYEMYKDYVKDPYELAITFIFERLVGEILKPQDRLECIFESRGEKEDKIIHSFMVRLCEIGTNYLSENVFKIINGIWFDPKRTKNNDKTYFGLELTDLVSYPIFKYCRSSEMDKAFDAIKTKIYNFPNNGHGLKRFP